MGDGVRFGIDEVRPIAAFIKNVSLAGGDDEHKFKGIHSAFSVGDTLKISVGVSGSPRDDEVTVLLLPPFGDPDGSTRGDLWDINDDTKNDSTVVELSLAVSNGPISKNSKMRRSRALTSPIWTLRLGKRRK